MPKQCEVEINGRKNLQTIIKESVLRKEKKTIIFVQK